ncbi:MAG TPA: glycosyl transferase family 2, partial [Nitrospiria bacterium]|nr:glycosyl transferase family 2 [Nitrospiria bacterium]
LASHFLDQDVWGTDVARYGIDIWMTTTAIANEANICQAYLGAKIHDPKDPGADLAAMMAQVVGSVFTLMEQHERLWKNVQATQPVPLFGFQYDVGLEPITVNVERMLRAFELGMKEFIPMWNGVLPEDVLGELKSLKPGEPDFKFPDELWVRIIFGFALAAHRKTMTQTHLLKSFTPLYLGRTAWFIQDTHQNTHSEVEEKIERLCMMFEQKKAYLTEQWNHSPNDGGKP